MSEFWDSNRVAKELGYKSTARIRQLAKTGSLPGAFQYTDGGQWFFDASKIIAFKRGRMRRRKICPSIKGKAHPTIGLSSSSKGRNIDARLDQLLDPKRTPLNAA